jgi:hypothetical protein
MSLRKSVATDTPKREMQQKPEAKLTSELNNRVFENDIPTRKTFKMIGADGAACSCCRPGNPALVRKIKLEYQSSNHGFKREAEELDLHT